MVSESSMFVCLRGVDSVELMKCIELSHQVVNRVYVCIEGIELSERDRAQ